MTTINILCTLEYLGAYGNLEHFGLTLQVASDANNVDANDQLLRPWLWSFNPTVPDTNTQPHIGLWQYKDGSSALTLISSVSVGNAGGADPELVKRLNAQFQTLRSSTRNSPFGWNLNPRSNPESAATPPKQQRVYRWPAQLAQLGRYPYPIPHRLNLSYFLEISAPLPTTDYLVAAPTFIANGTVYEPTIPVGPRNSDGTVTIAYSAQPADATGTTVQAIVQPIDAADCKLNVRNASSDTPIAKQDPYVSLPHPEDTAWQHDLIPLAAEFFDPSARFIGAFRLVMPQNQTPGASPPTRNSDYDALYTAIQDHFENCRQSIVSSLRNVADCGTQQAPGNVRNQDSRTGPSLLTRIVDGWVTAQSDSDRPEAQTFGDALISVLKGKLGQINFNDWATLLRKIPNLAGNPMLGPMEDRPKDSEKDKEFLRRLIALENLHLCFTQNEVLESIVTAQWDYCYGLSQVKLALVGPDKNGNLWRSFRQSANDQLGKLDLRQQLTAGNLGSNWNYVLSEMAAAVAAAPQTNTLSASKSALRTALSNALCAELSNCFTTPEVLPPLLKCLVNKSSCAAAGASTSWVDTQLQSIVKDAPDPNAPGAKRQRTRVSEGVTFALDTLSSQDSITDDPNDPLRSMAGLCILARQSNTGSKEWKCLNFAIACLDRKGKQVLTPAGAVIPIPLHDQAGLRNAQITYNNRPLMGLSPDMQFGDTLTSQDTKRLIEYLHPSLIAGSHVDGKIPGLRFGISYDFLVGLVRSSMALPNLFADPTNPGILFLKGDQNRVNELEAIFATHGLSTKYLRTVPVGELRFGNDDSGINQKFGLPVIPPEVQPRARDLENTVVPRTGNETPGSEPVILLTDYTPLQSPGVSQFAFSVFKPTTDIRTWDAWVAAKGISPGDRASIWADYHKGSNEQADGAPVRDLSLDDPAVDQLQVTVEWLDGGLSAMTLTLPWPHATFTSSLASLRSAPITICIAVSNGVSSLSLSNKNIVELAIPPGTLARLTLTPTLRDANLFADGILSQQNLGPFYRFLVETADTGRSTLNGKVIEAALPSTAELRLKFTASNTEETLTFALNVDPGSPPTKFRNIRYARLRLQSWRWDGRPGERFPWKADLSNLAATNPPEEIKAWEDTAFALRSIHDSNILVMSMDKTGKSFRAIEDIGNYRGVLYFRYGVEVLNRYGPLVPPEQRSVDSLGDDPTRALWSRCLVPLRWRGEIPKPAVKLVLPLTSSLQGPGAQTPSKTASLLVVLQGPWYSIGGLAERMQAELLYTGASGQLPEAGPDPIRWTGTRDQLNASYSLGQTFDPELGDMHLDGPIGHTFDDSDKNPLWVNCSFVLPPIEAKDKNGNLDTSWDLAKVQFRRVFDSAAPVAQLSPPVDKFSKPTDPYWIQFLPNYEYLNGDVSSPTSQVLLAVDRDDTNLTIRIKNRINNTLVNFRKDKHLLHFLLVTKLVPDLIGRVDQERMIDIVQTLDGQTWNINSSNVKTSDQLIGRVVEILVAPDKKIETGTSLWDALFPDDPNKDASGEIVGFSPPIYPSTYKATTCVTREHP